MAKKLSGFATQKANANKHTERGLKMLDQSIKNDGWIGAITTANDGECFDGSARLNTSLSHFGKDIEPIVIESDGTRPIVVKRTDIPDANDPKAKKLAIAANRIAQVDLEWDAEILAEIADEVDLTDLFLEEELAAIIGEDDSPTQKDEEDEDALDKALDDVGKVESRVKLGEIWQLGRHRLLAGDCTVESNVRALLGDRFEEVGMVWADPPYNIDYQGVSDKREKIANDKMPDPQFIEFLTKALFPASTIYCCCSWQYAHLFREALIQINRSPKAMIVWDKINPAQHLDKYFKQHEIIFYHGKFGGQKTLRGDVWQIARQRNTVHPTMKPIELLEMAFSDQPEEDLIFDPFLGAAPSIIAAQKMEGSRTVYGCEISLDYCEVIIKRFEDFTGETAKLIGHIDD